MQAAMQACASVRPSGAAGFGGGGGFNSTAMAAFTSCMKDHGVTVPATGGTRSLNTADPKTAAAYKTCKVLLPTRSSSPSPSPTT
jgi:hypothetical protein